jgi:hypothetical protein
MERRSLVTAGIVVVVVVLLFFMLSRYFAIEALEIGGAKKTDKQTEEKEVRHE